MKYLNKAMELTPDNPDIHNKMGIALLATGRPDEAITHFKVRPANKHNPGGSICKSRLGIYTSWQV